MNKDLLILIACIFSIIEIFIIINFFHKKKYYYFIETLVIYVSNILLLYNEYHSNFKTNIYIVLLVILTILGHSFIGQYLDIYNKSKYYDRFLHLFGSFSFSLFVYSIIYNVIKPINYSKLYVSLFVITLGISLGVVFEILEFTQDTFLKTRNQHGLKDTDFDLISDIIGATIAGIISTFIFL